MKTVTSHSVQTKFEQFSDLVKSREPVVITQYNRPTCLFCLMMMAWKWCVWRQKCVFCNLWTNEPKNAMNPPKKMAELSRIIKEEREAVYQERLKNAQ